MKHPGSIQRVGLSDAQRIIADDVPRRPIRMVIWHHFFRPNAAQYLRAEDGRALMRRVRRYHLKTRRWRDIAYNWLFGPDGSIWTGRTMRWAGAHTIGCNSISVGLAMCLDGDHEKLSDFPEMEAAILGLTAALCDVYSFTEQDLFYHRDFANKSCPGWLLDKFAYRASLADILREPEAPFVRLKLDDILHPGRVPLAINPRTNRVEFVDDFTLILRRPPNGFFEVRAEKGDGLRHLLEGNGYRIPPHGWHPEHGPAGTCYAYRADDG